MRKIVVHINVGTSGGPGGIVNSVYEVLEKIGYDNYIISPRGETTKRILKLGKYEFYFSRILTKILEKMSKLKNKGFYPEVFCSNKAYKINRVIGKNIDYIILYWYKNFIDYKTIKTLKETNNCKIYIYPMDYASMTGGCHYPGDCSNYLYGCGKCPGILKGSLLKDLTYINIKKMKKELENSNVTLLCGSKVVFDKAEESYQLKKLNKELIIPPLGDEYLIEEEIKSLKKHFGLNLNNKIIFFGAENISNERKGFRYLIEALTKVVEKLSDEEKKYMTLLIAGNGDIKEIEQLNIEIKLTGYLNKKELIKAYKVSDLFISPSIIDGGPMMVKEAIMTGTPVVCFKNVGNAGEFVHDGITGFRAEFKNVEDMANKIIKIIKLPPKEHSEMKSNCKKLGEEKMSYLAFGRKIENIFLKGEQIK